MHDAFLAPFIMCEVCWCLQVRDMKSSVCLVHKLLEMTRARAYVQLPLGLGAAIYNAKLARQTHVNRTTAIRRSE